MRTPRTRAQHKRAVSDKGAVHASNGGNSGNDNDEDDDSESPDFDIEEAPSDGDEDDEGEPTDPEHDRKERERDSRPMGAAQNEQERRASKEPPHSQAQGDPVQDQNQASQPASTAGHGDSAAKDASATETMAVVLHKDNSKEDADGLQDDFDNDEEVAEYPINNVRPVAAKANRRMRYTDEAMAFLVQVYVSPVARSFNVTDLGHILKDFLGEGHSANGLRVTIEKRVKTMPDYERNLLLSMHTRYPVQDALRTLAERAAGKAAWSQPPKSRRPFSKEENEILLDYLACIPSDERTSAKRFLDLYRADDRFKHRSSERLLLERARTALLPNYGDKLDQRRPNPANIQKWAENGLHVNQWLLHDRPAAAPQGQEPPPDDDELMFQDSVRDRLQPHANEPSAVKDTAISGNEAGSVSATGQTPVPPSPPGLLPNDASQVGTAVQGSQIQEAPVQVTPEPERDLRQSVVPDSVTSESPVELKAESKVEANTETKARKRQRKEMESELDPQNDDVLERVPISQTQERRGTTQDESEVFYSAESGDEGNNGRRTVKRQRQQSEQTQGQEFKIQTHGFSQVDVRAPASRKRARRVLRDYMEPEYTVPVDRLQSRERQQFGEELSSASQDGVQAMVDVIRGQFPGAAQLEAIEAIKMCANLHLIYDYFTDEDEYGPPPYAGIFLEDEDEVLMKSLSRLHSQKLLRAPKTQGAKQRIAEVFVGVRMGERPPSSPELRVLGKHGIDIVIDRLLYLNRGPLR